MLATRKIEQLEMALKMAEASHANSRKEIERMKGIVTLAEEEKNKAQERLNPTYLNPPCHLRRRGVGGIVHRVSH